MRLIKGNKVSKRQTFANGDIYEGELIANTKHGRGVLIHPNGDKYEGDWKDDKRHGRGSLKFINGNKYDGEWKEDKGEGKGVFIWANGNRYEGSFKGYKRHGKGVYTLTNGDKYCGEWKYNKMHGRGVYTLTNGKTYDGQWEKSRKHGKGKIIFENKDVYEGCFFSEGNKFFIVGKGRITLGNGLKIIGGSKSFKLQFIFHNKKINYENKDCYTILNKWQKHHKLKMPLCINHEPASLNKIQNSEMCKLCTDNSIKIIFAPCGHRVMCETCYNKLKVNPVCPICSQNILSYIISIRD